MRLETNKIANLETQSSLSPLTGLFLFLFVIVSVSAQAYSPMPLPDMDHTDLHKAAGNCDVKKERAALSALPPKDRNTEINRLDREGYTPLGYAARSGCMKIVKLLIESGAVVDAAERHSRSTPLLSAAENRHADVVRYLLKHGAKVNHRAAFGQTPLTAAILGSMFDDGRKGNRDETIDALLSNGADVNLPGMFGRTAAMTALFQGDANLVRRLISKGADLSAKDDDGKTALDYAEERDEQEIRDILKHSRPAAH